MQQARRAGAGAAAAPAAPLEGGVDSVALVVEESFDLQTVQALQKAREERDGVGVDGEQQQQQQLRNVAV